jgi:hypothetical protein
MSDEIKWQVDELIARYDLEPSLKDIFVEGLFDNEILSRSSEKQTLLDYAFYEIDSVEISKAMLEKHGLTYGNKQKLQVLARELSGLSSKCGYRCVVDRDLDHWFDPLETTPRLTWTPYCSIELFFWNDEFLRDILETAAQVKIDNWELFRQSLTEVLLLLFIMRVADRDLGWKMNWISFDRCLSVKGNYVKLDIDDYINRLLLANARGKDKADFDACLVKWQREKKSDSRLQVRGHDFVEILAWSVIKFKGIKEFATPKAIERLLILLADRAINVRALLD